MPPKSLLYSAYPDLLADDRSPEREQVVADLDRVLAAASPSMQQVTRIEQALQARITAQYATRQSRVRLALPRWQMTALLAVVLLGGAGYALAPLLTRLFDDAAAFDHSIRHISQANLWQPIDQSQTIDGFTVTVRRAYADANRVIIAYTIEMPPEYGPFDITAREMRLTTADGTELPWPQYGVGYVFGDSNIGSMYSFDAAAIQGAPAELTLHLTMRDVMAVRKDTPLPEPGTTMVDRLPHITIPGPFEFDFTVPFIAGRVAELNQTVTANGVPLTLERVVVTPSETRTIVR